MREIRRTGLVCLGLILGTILLYWPVFGFGFVSLDDPGYVAANIHLFHGTLWQRLAYCLETNNGGYWMPMVWLSYLIDAQFSGPNPAAYHVTNVILHAANAALLFLVLKRMTGAFWRSAAVAALFAWHPMHVESVAWIAERKDVLSVLFWMLTMWAYVNYIKNGGARRYALVTLFFVLGLMAKAMLVTLPFVLLLLDWWPLRRPEGDPREMWQRLLLEKAPWLALAVGFALVTGFLQRQSGAVTSFDRLPLLPRLENAVISYARYIEKTVWPTRLSAMYPLHAWPVTDVIAIAVFLAAISYRLFVVRKTFPYLTVGWLWFFGTLVPVIGIVQSGPQGMADRFNYIPSIGLFIMVCWGIDGLWRVRFTGLEWGLWPVGVAVLALCCAATCKQIQYWRDTGTLTRHAIDLDPNNFIARTAYGVFLYERQSYPAAIAELQRAIEIVPQFPNSHAFLGRVLYHTGQPDAAAVELRTAIRLNPAEVEAHTDLGSILLDQKMAAGAEQEFVTGLKYEPDNAGIHSLLGKALAQEGRSEEARQQFLTAHNLDPAYSLPLAE